jgi:PAS domain S-box-containing protein
VTVPVPEPVLTGTLVVRDRRVIYASAGAAALLGRPSRELVGLALLELLAPGERLRVGERHERRLRREPVPSEYEVTLLLPGGGERAVEVQVSLEPGTEGDEVVLRLRDLSGEHGRRARLAGVAALGVAIHRELDPAAILDQLGRGLLELGLATFLMQPDGDGIRLGRSWIPEALVGVVRERLGSLEGLRGGWTPFSRTAWEEGAAFSDDWIDQAARFAGAGLAAAVRTLVAGAGMSRAVALRLDPQRGPRPGYLVVAGDWLRPGDLAPLRLLASQVSAAMDAATVVAELSRQNAALAHLDRLAELAGTSTDLEALVPAALEVVREASGARAVAIYTVDEPAGLLRRAGYTGGTAALAFASSEIGLDSTMGRALLAQRSEVRQAQAVPPGYRGMLEEAGLVTFAYVPLLARSRPLGIMVVAWGERRDEPTSNLELLLGMGAHLAAALEAHSLLADLRRRVDELTLLNDVAVASATLDPVLLLENAARRVSETIGADTAEAYLVEDGRLLQQVSLGLAPEVAALVRELELGEGPPGLAVTRLGAVTDPTEEELGPRCREARARSGTQAVVAVPLLAKTRAVGALCLGRLQPVPFARGDARLLSAIGAQLGVAVEGARLFADTRRQLRDLAAVHGLAAQVLAAPPGDARAILDDGCRVLTSALGARAAVVSLLDEDQRLLRGAAAHGLPLPLRELVAPPERLPLAAEAIAGLGPAWMADVTADARGAMQGLAGVPPLSLLALPLAARDRVRGVVFVAGEPDRRLSDAELALARALVGELAVALENAELYAEARRRLAELTTVIEVARVVSSSLDPQRVMEAGAEHLRQTLGAAGCSVVLRDARTGRLRRAAVSGLAVGETSPDDDGPSLAGEALTSLAPRAGRVPGPDGAPLPVLAVPLHVRDQALGVALIVLGEPGGRFLPGDQARALAIASQLSVAVDNARLHAEVRRRAEELVLLQDVGRSLVATLDLAQVLDTGVRNLARMVEAPEAWVLLLEDDPSHLAVEAVAGPRQSGLGKRLPADPAGSFAGLVVDRTDVVVVTDAAADPRVRVDPLLAGAARALMGLPLVVKDRTIGAAIIVETERPRRFEPAEVQRAAAIANQLAVAVDHARAHASVRDSLARLERTQQRLVEQERLVALGQMSAVVAHEVRNPLQVIFNSLSSLRQLVRPEGDAGMLLDIVGEEADRLSRIVTDLLDFARPAAPDLRPERLERVVDEALAAALAHRPPGLELVRETPRPLPPFPLDAHLVRQAVLNVTVNAVQAMPRGGRLTIRTLEEGGAAVLEIEDTGPGMEPSVRDRIFEPFFTTKASGTGLGLAVVKRTLDGHGGEVRVRSHPGVGTAFTLRFPLVPAAPPPQDRVESTQRIG